MLRPLTSHLRMAGTCLKSTIEFRSPQRPKRAKQPLAGGPLRARKGQ
jgi:hypothetical protein